MRAERGSEELTPREQEILVLVAQGRSNGEIGKQLFISTKTVSVHVSNILAKLQARGARKRLRSRGGGACSPRAEPGSVDPG